jgi:pimeloyl-ACP methyl ester carboxylesterase
MKSIVLQGRRYAFEEVGTGTPLLLLHGFPFSSASFAPQLKAGWPHIRVIAPDHRGFGNSEPLSELSTMEALALDALALLDALHIPSAYVGGVSMGGYVSLALARLDPGRVRGLILMNTQSTADDAATQARRRAVADEVRTSGTASLVAGMMLKLFSPTTGSEVKKQVETMMQHQAPEAVALASLGMGQRTDAKDILSRFAGPVLITVGEHDAVTPVDKARVMAGLSPQAQLHIVSDAGHLANIEAPMQVNALIETFVTSAEAQRPPHDQASSTSERGRRSE